MFVLEAYGVKLHPLLLLNVSFSPVNTNEWQNAIKLSGGNIGFQDLFAIKSLQDQVTKTERELSAFTAGKMPKVKNESHLLELQRLLAIFQKYPLSNSADAVSQQNSAAIQAQWMDIDDAAAANEVLTKPISVATGNEDSAIWSALFEVGAIYFSQKPFLNESMSQVKVCLV